MAIPLAAAPIIGAGISAVGGLLTNRREIRASEHMATHGYQHAVADLRKAGLNPLLAYAQGPETGRAPDLDNPLGYAGEAASSAVRLKTERDRVTSETELNTELGRRAYLEGDRAIADKKYLEEQTRRSVQERRLLEQGAMARLLGTTGIDDLRALPERLGLPTSWEDMKRELLKPYDPKRKVDVPKILRHGLTRMQELFSAENIRRSLRRGWGLPEVPEKGGDDK